eukprot:CAMPEP_0170166802 /NCGR_PEP_ID=MMETSP0040_2-20121228/375_1 /TAXON_ID=641309 /ORGANISM="Lotharella oceanica, Strain CCMP622" /LENGTH=51 /DNA_ID=CAMNT_0010404619 /DNA_START=144 /DNA_END=296 /DNA_ORIENTATION=+
MSSSIVCAGGGDGVIDAAPEHRWTQGDAIMTPAGIRYGGLHGTHEHKRLSW